MTAQDVKTFCRTLGLPAVGIASASLPIPPTQGDICPLASGRGIDRYDPCRLLPLCRSIIVVLFPYFCGYPKNSNLSLYTHSYDYHTIIHSYLNRIGQFTEKAFPGSSYYSVVDTSPLSDRHLAVTAGLGFIGDNGCLIHETYGSYCFIGAVLTTAALEVDEPTKKECLHCGNCEKICPGKCFSGSAYNFATCKSYLTQKKGDLTVQEQKVIAKTPYIFGCDECQRVCPHNKDIPVTPLADFRTDLLSYVDARSFKNLTNRQFKETYGKRAFSWRGKAILIRNFTYIEQENTPESKK